MNLSKHNNSIQLIILLILLTMSFILSNCGGRTQKKVYKVGILCGLDYISILPDVFLVICLLWGQRKTPLCCRCP